MIVSDTSGFIFVHNPKCAGTSVRTALRNYDTAADLFWMFDTWNGKQIDKAHMPLYMFRTQFPRYFELFARYTSFMFVRNPYDRAVSAFNEVHRETMPGDDASEDVEAYARALNAFLVKLQPTSFRRNPYKFRHFVRQRDLCYLQNKAVVDVAMKVEDWPGCLAKLEIFLPDVAERLRVARKRNVKSLTRAHRSYLTPESIAAINLVYKEDFILFDYPMLPAEP